MDTSNLNFVENLKSNPNIVRKFKEKKEFVVLKQVRDSQKRNLLLLTSLIQSRISNQKNIGKIDSSFQMRIEPIGEANTLIIKSSFKSGKDIPFKTNIIMKEIVLMLINETIRGPNSYFYTYKNVQYDMKTQQLYTNNTSNIGLLFLSKKKLIPKLQFAQIYQLLDPALLQEKDLKEKMHYRLKFRAIAVFILSFALGDKLNLFFQMDHYDTYITYEEATKPVSLLFDRYVWLLSKKSIIKKIQEFQNRDKANYSLFLKRVFLDQCKGLTWSEVIYLLVFRYKSIKLHTEIFLDFADELFQIEVSKQYWEELGLGESSQRQWYLIAKLGVGIGKIIQFQSFEEYIRTEKNWDEEKERVCMTILHLLNKLEQKYKNQSHSKEKIEGQAQMITENKEKPKQESTFTRFSQIYQIVQAAIGHYRAKRNQTQIKYMSNEKRILNKFLNL